MELSVGQLLGIANIQDRNAMDFGSGRMDLETQLSFHESQLSVNTSVAAESILAGDSKTTNGGNALRVLRKAEEVAKDLRSEK